MEAGDERESLGDENAGCDGKVKGFVLALDLARDLTVCIDLSESVFASFQK